MKSEIGSDVKRSVRENFAVQLECGILVTCEYGAGRVSSDQQRADLSEHNESARIMPNMLHHLLHRRTFGDRARESIFVVSGLARYEVWHKIDHY